MCVKTIKQMPEIHCVCMLIHQFCQIKKKKKSQDQRGLDLSFIDTLEETHSAHAFSQSQLNITKTMLSFYEHQNARVISMIFGPFADMTGFRRKNSGF